MKKIMILGAGSGQIPFIQISKEFGCEVLVVSPEGEYPGFEIADKKFFYDTRDKDSILKLAQTEQIDAIATDQTDVAVTTVAYVAEKMNIRGIGYDLATIFTDKYLMRKAAKQIGVGVPSFFKAKSCPEIMNNISSLKFPVVIKPTNSSGSRGVYKINNIDEIEKAFCDSVTYSSTGEVIVEEFIEGREYIVDGIALDNKYINLDVGIKEYFEIKGQYISKMCMFSSVAKELDEAEKALIDANAKLVKGLELPFGLTHGEYIYSDIEKKVYLVEIAARGGGVNLSSDLTPRATGMDTNRILLDYIINGNVIDIEKVKLEKCVTAWRCFELVPGVVNSIEGIDEVNKIDGVFRVCLDEIKIGKIILPLINDTRKHGPILVCGKDRTECFNIIDSVKKKLKITTIDENGNVSEIKW